MKKSRLAIVFLLCITLIGSNICYAASTSDMVNENIEGNEKISWTAAIEALQWILIKADGKLFYRDPTSSSTSTSVTTSSGTVQYGKDAQRTKFNFNVSSGKSLDLWAQTSFSGWLKKISIFVENSSGNQVAGNYVTHNQHIFTSIGSGKYSCYYVGSDGDKWDSWLTISQSSKRANDNKGVMDYTTGKEYVIPSAQHREMQERNVSNELNATELDNEFFDDELGISVNMTKHFDVGETIIFKDVIDGIQYIPEENKTILTFKTDKGEDLVWPFSNDLSNEFSVGEEISLDLKVVSEFESEGYTFQNLDYILEAYAGMENNIYPDIHNYLL